MQNFAIKRCEQFLPLCTEHLDALLFVNHLSQGLTNGTELRILGDYTGWFLKNHIHHHHYREETILLGYLPPLHPMCTKLKEEHEEIHKLMNRSYERAERGDLEKTTRYLNAHINWEETELYTWLESTLTEKELNEMLEKLSRKIDHDKNEWHYPFWLE